MIGLTEGIPLPLTGDGLMTLLTASYRRMPVTSHVLRTDARAPNTSILWYLGVTCHQSKPCTSSDHMCHNDVPCCTVRCCCMVMSCHVWKRSQGLGPGGYPNVCVLWLFLAA